MGVWAGTLSSSDFFLLRYSLFIINQWFNSLAHVDMTYICWESRRRTSWKSIISSAYKWYLIVGYLFIIWDIGIIYIIKSKGPNTEPWGTPEVNRAGFDWELPIFIEKVLFLMDIYHCKAILHKPNIN